MTAVSSEINEDLLEAVFRANRFTLAEVEQVLREFGLCPTEFGVLEAITVLGPQPIQILAKRVLVTSGSMTYTVNQLIKKELVTREACSEDGRRCYLHLTKKGEALIKKALAAHNSRVAEVFGTIDEDEKRELTRLLTKIWDRKGEK